MAGDLKMKYSFQFSLGAVGYSFIEILVRGYTHWSMAVLGGLCLMLLCGISRRFCSWNIGAQALLGAAVITAVELCAGILLNHILGWNVWDYYAYPFNLWGQICPLFSFFWFLLCVPVFFALRQVQKRLSPAVSDKHKTSAPS